jgi:uncharacterized protein (DUF2336 family)
MCAVPHRRSVLVRMKSSASNPLDSLVDLACRDGVDIRPTLLRVLTDLYVQKPVHGLEEETQFVELALGLIDTVDASTRAAVAARLSAYPGAPAAVLGRLGRLGTPGRLAGLSPAGTGGRDETGRDSLLELFFSASSEERRLILINLDVASAPGTRRAAPVAGELVRRLENAALKRNHGEFTRVLERALGVSHALAERIARDNSGEPLVVAARALGIKAEVLQRILLFLNPVIGQSAQRLYELSHLYDELNAAAAESMASIWRAAAPRPPTREPSHEPVYWNDERPALRPTANPTAKPGRALPRHDRLARSRGNER